MHIIHHNHYQTASIEFRLPENYSQCLRQQLGSTNPENADHDMSHLDADFRERLAQVLEAMHEQGYDTTMLEGYRSPERQAFLKTFGAGGVSVTNARQCQSFHQFGLAADIGFLKDGKPDLNTKQAWVMKGYRLLGELADSQGLNWGGKWGDLGHVELRKPIFSNMKLEWRATEFATLRKSVTWKPYAAQVCPMHKPVSPTSPFIPMFPSSPQFAWAWSDSNPSCEV